MKKIILTTPFVLLISMFTFNTNLEAAGCDSHKTKNIKVDCSSSEDICDNKKINKKFNKVEA